jgi:hypothetical protein
MKGSQIWENRVRPNSRNVNARLSFLLFEASKRGAVYDKNIVNFLRADDVIWTPPPTKVAVEGGESLLGTPYM